MKKILYILLVLALAGCPKRPAEKAASWEKTLETLTPLAEQGKEIPRPSNAPLLGLLLSSEDPIDREIAAIEIGASLEDLEDRVGYLEQTLPTAPFD